MSSEKLAATTTPAPLSPEDTDLFDKKLPSATIRWIPDAEVSFCKSCGLLFDWVRRKHHCRYCGIVEEFQELEREMSWSLIRADKILTSPEKRYLSVNSYSPQRVCGPCHNILMPDQPILRETASNAVQPNSINETGSKRFLNSPYSFTLREEVRKAAYSVKNFMLDGVIKDQSIPLPLLTNAQGIAFLTVLKVGFVLTGRLGTGLVLSKLPDGSWSAPSAIGTAGIGWGAQIGGEVTDFVIILNTRSAVDTFCAQGQVNLGAELGVAAGPLGRVAAGSMEAGIGLFIGISLEGSVIVARPDVNREFYGKDVTAAELLSGQERPPIAAQPLYDALEAVAIRQHTMTEGLHLMVPKHILENVVEGTKTLLSEKRVLNQKLDEANVRIFALERQLADQQLRAEVAMHSMAKSPPKPATHRFKNLTLQVMKTKMPDEKASDDLATVGKKDLEINKLLGKTNELETLLAATRAITHQTAHREVVSSTLNAARNLVAARKYTLAITSEGKSTINLYSMGAVSLMEEKPANKYGGFTDEGTVSVDNTTTFGHVMMMGTVFDAMQATTTGMFASQMEDLDFTPHSVLCVPIRNAHGTILGALQVVTQRQHSDEYMHNQVFTSLDKERLEHLCVVAGSAVWNLRLSKERQMAQSRIEILLRLNRSIAVEVNSAALLEKIMDVSYELLRCECANLYLKIQGERDLFVAHGSDHVRGQYVSIDKGIAGLVARTGQVVTTNNAIEHPCFDKELDERNGQTTRKVLCVPVKDPEGNILAVVEATNKLDSSDFSVEDTLFLNYIAEAAGISLHKAMLLSEVIIAKRLTDIRLKLNDYVLHHSDIHSLTDLIMVHGKAIMECDRFGFLLVDHLKNELWITSNNGNLGDQVTVRQPIYKGISGLVATTGETVCTRDAYTHSLFDPTHDNLTGYRTTSVLCMPVFEEHVPSKPKVVAVAMCINKLQGSQVIAFNDQDKTTMSRLCTEIQFALGQMSLEVCYFKVVSDRNLSGNSEVTEAGIISSLLQKYSRNHASGIMTSKTADELAVHGSIPPAADVFGRDIKLTQRPELDQWDLDILSFSFTEVIQSVQTLFRAYGFVDAFAISNDKLAAFVASVAQHYRANSYHNFYHAFQVLHSAHIQIKAHMRKLLTGVDIFAVLIAALCHDVDHPGNNNDFEVKCMSAIALTHNDDAVLERHHCRVTFLILNTPSTNILEKVAPDAFRAIRRTIIRCIMATDMASHFSQCKTIENLTRHQFQDPSNRMLVMELIVHASDLSAQALPYKLALKWGERALDEFQSQAREEADMHLTVAPFMENLENKGTRLKVQSNFICYVLQPLWMSYGQLVPSLRFYTDSLNANLDHYRADLAEFNRTQQQQQPPPQLSQQQLPSSVPHA
ncbi:unnamed protein product [Aphanomyces euteiches]